jgi:hypothetical protein
MSLYPTGPRPPFGPGRPLKLKFNKISKVERELYGPIGCFESRPLSPENIIYIFLLIFIKKVPDGPGIPTRPRGPGGPDPPAWPGCPSFEANILLFYKTSNYGLKNYLAGHSRLPLGAGVSSRPESSRRTGMALRAGRAVEATPINLSF